MRPWAGIGLTCLTAVSAAGLSVASVNSAGSDGLSDTSMIKSADFSTIFSGGSASDRVSDDPDAPIRTSRFDPPVVPQGVGASAPGVELAGGMTQDGASDAVASTAPSAAFAVQTASAEPEQSARDAILARVLPADAGPQARPAIQMAALAAPGRPYFQPDARPFGLFSPDRRVALSLTTDESPLNPGSGLTFGARDGRQNPAAAPIPAKSKLFDARRLGLQVDVSPVGSRKGRWFVFAATSGDALGFNLFGDPAKAGRNKNGWSVEKLAEFGKVQLGLGWRKGPMQVSAVATQREIGAYGYQQEDTVFGLSFTISGGKRLPAPKGRRGIPRGD